jgi:hypothetical protein
VASAKQDDIQPGQQVRFIVQCMLIRGEYLGLDENGLAKVQTKKRGIVRVDKSILRANEKSGENATTSITQRPDSQ